MAKLICADFSAIEGRVIAWLAQEEYVLQNYRDGKDPYCVFASQLSKNSYEDIYAGYKAGIDEFKAMRQDGKTGELACGYQGWTNAIWQFAPELSAERAEEIAHTWRTNRPMTVKLWRGLEDAAVRAIQHPGEIFGYGMTRFVVHAGFLKMQLPNGRMIHYYSPAVRTQYRNEKPKPQITYYGVEGVSRHWGLKTTYGGKLTENLVQGVARDLLVEALFRLEAAGYPVVLHVHDEAVSEVQEATEADLKRYEDIMSIVPEWADGLPVRAEGWFGKRYRK